jgi:hypothetical protein
MMLPTLPVKGGEWVDEDKTKSSTTFQEVREGM